MTYSATLGPYVPCFGRFDTLANLVAYASTTNPDYGTMAFCDDTGWVWTDKTIWRRIGQSPAAGRQTFTSGASGTVSSGVTDVFLNGVNTTFALTLPVPVDGQRININASAAVSVALTLTPTSPATAFLPASPPSTLAAGVGIAYVYDSAATKWYRVY